MSFIEWSLQGGVHHGSLRCGVHHGGSDGYNPCKFPCRCVCRLYRVRDELERAVEDLVEHGRMVNGLLPLLHQNGKKLVEQASSVAEGHFFLPTWIALGSIPISVIDGAKLALDRLDALFSGDDFESAIDLVFPFESAINQVTPFQRGFPQSCAAYTLIPINFDQPWRQFLDNDEWVIFVMLWLQLNVINAKFLIRTLKV